jgi:nudix-type nucleoside diphosphatase (YffH/AdpP family)
MDPQAGDPPDVSDHFFYGTLCHPPLLTAVLGRPVDAEPARLAGFAVAAEEGGRFPLLRRDPGAEAAGVLVRGLTAQDRARLDYYEAGFAFDVELHPVGGTMAAVYVPRQGRWQAGAPWDLAGWALRFGAAATATAGDVMAAMARGEPADRVLARYPQMLARGGSRVRAAAGGPATVRRATLAGDVAVRRADQPWAGFFAVERFDLAFRHFGGGMSREVERTVFISADAVTVLPYDPARDRVLLIEQFRPGPFARGDAEVWSLEAIAGRIDPGESPEEAARREAVEEAGLVLGPLLHVAGYYPSPAGKSEYLYSYVALADLPDGIAGVHGVAGEAEDIRGHLMSFERMMALVDSGEIANAPMILTALWLARHRDRLRGAQ